MIFDKNDDVRNERILYQAKPNMLFGCKKAIYGIVLLVIVFILSPKVIQFVGNMQVYLISYINLALTRYAAIGFFIVILFIILFIIWQLIGWYSKEYILTQSRIIIKYGVLSTKKNYMPYAAIQDINTSQSVFGKIFNVGTISLFSAYDNNQMELSAISNPSEVEEIIFSNMVNHRAYGEPNSYPHNDMSYGRNFQTNDSYLEKNDYYDEFEPITPIGREKDRYPRRDYEYYPDDFSQGENNRKKYEYEPYNDNFYDVEDKQFEPRYKEPLNQFSMMIMVGIVWHMNLIPLDMRNLMMIMVGIVWHMNLIPLDMRNLMMIMVGIVRRMNPIPLDMMNLQINILIKVIIMK